MADHRFRNSPALHHFNALPVRGTALQMAFVQIEADEVRVSSPSTLFIRSDLHPQRIEEGPEGLQFHCARQSLPYPGSWLILLQLTWALGTTQTRRGERAAQVR